MTTVNSGRNKEKEKSAPAVSHTLCAVLCSLICAVSLIIFSAEDRTLPVSSVSDMETEDSFWENFSQFTARIFSP